jgi:hypothetical protein
VNQTKHQFKAGDRVMIARQPKSQWVPLVGEVGVIDEIQGEHCMVRTYSMNGGCGGSGTLPLSCLEPFASKALEVQIADYQASLDRLSSQAEARKSKWNQLVLETSTRTGVDINLVEEILLIGRQWKGPGD